MKRRKQRVLQVIRDLEWTGRQTWLYNLLKYIDKRRFQFEFLLQDASNEIYVDRFRRLGAEIHQIRETVDSFPFDLRYMVSLARFFKDRDPFDVVHFHDGLDSVLPLTAARVAGIPIRIIHSHSYYIRRKDWFSPTKTGIRWFKRKLIRRYATHGFASRPHNASALFGRYWIHDQRWHNFFCGIDLSTFEGPAGDLSIRQKLGIPEGAFVVGHVGYFSNEKNHAKIISVFAALRRLRPDAHLLLIGDGWLRETMAQKVRRFGLSDHVHFAGNRTDVPFLMKNAMDIFLFPSRYIGLGTAFLEAQAAGLPCVISEDIPKTVEVVARHVVRLDLDSSDEAWAEALVSTAELGRSPFNRQLFSRFDIERSIDIWQRVYSTGAVF